MKRTPDRPRIEDVAARAGVSTATVSRFFTRRELVSRDTAERIGRAVEDLGYVPNLLAGSLASRRSRLVAILLPSLSQSPFIDTIQSIAEALGERGYTPMLGITGAHDEHLPTVLDAALGRQVDGVVFTGLVADESIRKKLLNSNATVIETWGLPERAIDCAVGFSHFEVGRATANYIRQRGYSRPLIINAKGTRSIERRDGFLAVWGQELREIEVESHSNFTQARSVFRAFKAMDLKPDVIIAGSDGLAQGLIVEATHAGFSIPDDLAIMGFGNRSVAADMRPSITTIAIDGARIGQEAARLLHQRSEGQLQDDRILDIGFRIIERESA